MSEALQMCFALREAGFDVTIDPLEVVAYNQACKVVDLIPAPGHAIPIHARAKCASLIVAYLVKKHREEDPPHVL